MSSNYPYIPPHIVPPWEAEPPESVTWKFRDMNGNVISFDVIYDDSIEIYLGDRDVTAAVRSWFPDLYSDIENRVTPNED